MTRSPFAAFVVLAATCVVLTGCSAASVAPGSDPTPHPEPIVQEPVIISGSGEVITSLEPPEGAESVRVRVSCTSGSLVVWIDSQNDGARSNMCGNGVNRIELALLGARPALTVLVADDVQFVAELSYSTEPLESDPEVEEQCDALSAVTSILYNADEAVTRGDLDAVGWRGRIDEAATQLNDVSETGLIGPLRGALFLALIDMGSVPGAFTDNPTAAFLNAVSMATGVCNDNGSPLFVSAQYGG